MHKGQSNHLGFLGSRHQILLPVFVNKEIFGKARAIARIDLKGRAQPRLLPKLEDENFIGALQITQNNTITLKNNNRLLLG